MRGIGFSFLAAGSASLSNFFFHRNSHQSEKKVNSNIYLLFFYLVSFLASLILCYGALKQGISFTMLGLGVFVGLLNVLLMILTSRALQKGPAGLTFAFLSVSAVFPGLLLFLFFGEENGFSFSYQQLIGILLVVLGLYLGTKNESGLRPMMLLKWLKYALAGLAVQILALSLIQGRLVVFDYTPFKEAESSFSIATVEDAYFMIGQFGAAFLVQVIYFFTCNCRWPKKEVFYGSLGGAANFLSTFMLLLATKWALPYEKGILFPCFAVATLILCNLWANRLYGEKFNTTSNTTCAFGILIGLIK